MSARVAFVIVSHSKQLADGVVELAGQMAPEVTMVAAGGTDDGGLGTSYDLVEGAVASALGDVQGLEDGGVVLLTDLGSATMTVESVIEMADDPDVLRFVDAPLVEGAVAAAVRAQVGDSLEQVAAAASSAGTQFAGSVPVGAGADSAPAATTDETGGSAGEEGILTATAVVADPTGLHARPAAIFARTASDYDADVQLNGVDAGSVLELMSLGVKQGETVTLRSSGPQAREALDALVAAIETA